MDDALVTSTSTLGVLREAVPSAASGAFAGTAVAARIADSVPPASEIGLAALVSKRLEVGLAAAADRLASADASRTSDGLALSSPSLDVLSRALASGVDAAVGVDGDDHVAERRQPFRDV